jgi:diguanylate cyclase (GGDEF)-like protein/PAS domain S-box-containing protein
MIDPQGRICFWNRAAECVLGHTAAEALGADVHELIAPERYHEARRRAFPRFAATGMGDAIGRTLELSARRKDGEEIPVELSLSSVSIDGRWHAVGIVRDVSARKAIERELEEQTAAANSMAAAAELARAQVQHERENLEAIFDAADVGLFLLDRDSTIVQVNDAAADLVGTGLAEFIGRRPGDALQCVHALSTSEGCGHASACQSCGMRNSFEHAMQTGERVRHVEVEQCVIVDGAERQCFYLVSASRIHLSGEPFALVVVADITEQKRNEQRLRDSEARFQAVFEKALMGIAIVEVGTKTIVSVNPAACRMMGEPAERLVGTRCRDRFCRAGYNRCPILEQDVRVENLQSTLLHSSGRETPILKSAAMMMLDGRLHLIECFVDIDARVRAEQELRQAAEYDRLTELPNRRLLVARLERLIARCESGHHHFAVLFLDFDRFKVVNDSLGHGVGDLLLKQIAHRLAVALEDPARPGRLDEATTIARWGGDEFVVLLGDLPDTDVAVTVADRLLGALAQPYTLGEHEVVSTASIGIVTSDVSASDAETMLRDADAAMYEAKAAGKGRYALFDTSMRQRAEDRLRIEIELRRVLDEGELSLVYQPIIDLDTGEVESLEALLRWHHPQLGEVPPDRFIPIAEETGLIVPIGRWVLEEACCQFASWRRTLGRAAPRSISVNLARQQLTSPYLVRIVGDALEASGVSPASLHLEVTESEIMSDTKLARETLESLRALSVKIDIDDFGTGYSSLACLQEFPIDVLKMDRAFVSNVTRGRNFAALAHAVVELAENLGIRVIAEGIESIDELLVVHTMGCRYGQGYLLGRPMPADDVPHFRVARDPLDRRRSA